MTDAKLNELKGDKERFVAFSFAAADLLVELDAKGKICFVSGAAKGITGVDSSKLISMDFGDLLDPLDQRMVCYLLKNMKEGERINPVGARMKNTNVSAIVGACSLPRTHGHIYLAINVSALPAAQSLAVNRDTETGLLDKNDFVMLAKEQLALAADTGQDLELTLLHLENIRDMASHTTEDGMTEFLDKMGAVLRGYSYGGDSAGRIDGDKYGVLHSKSMDSELLRSKVETLSDEVAPGHGLAVKASNVNLDKGHLSAEHASQALMFVVNSYINNEGSEFKIENLADGLQGRMETTMNRISSLKTVFLKNQFNLVYQPIVSLLDESTHHYEVLCRFKNGESPFETVTFAEEVGIIIDLDLAVVKKSLEYLKSFLKTGTKPPNLAINISGHSLESDAFVDSLMQLIELNKDVSNFIGLEITETSEVGDLIRADRIIQNFRRKGIHVSLDDLGSGSASFQYIRALNTDFVKIDGAYVRDVLNNERDKAILKSMARLCIDLKIGTIAEMVETKEQAALLKNIGIGYAQGWLFSKPVDEIVVPKARNTMSINMKRQGFKAGWG
ncbi:EAL domain-containing protein [Sneathiella limimaris]|uniref:EAL domain-containing protein n=1 Tax=Sneathiella limimaris TaxID=1964213 RepID=UPI00146C3251